MGMYFGMLMLTLGLAEPTGLVSLPVLFWLKDGLGLGPQSVALFEAVILIPAYFGFAFGFMRDRWRPFGLGDRAYFWLVGPIAIACYAWLAGSEITWTRLLAGMVVAATAIECLHATTEAQMTAAAQRYAMSGGFSVLGEIAEVVPGMIALLIGGWMASSVSPRTALLVAAIVMAVVLLQSSWKTSFAATEVARDAGDTENNAQAVRRLLRHRALPPVMAALVLWNFSPGFGTALLFYLTDQVKVSPEVYGAYGAVLLFSGAVGALAYAAICRRVALGTTLRWMLVLNLFPAFLLLVARDGMQVLLIAALIGLLLGMGNVALFDLLRRACPTRLEGTGIMLGYSVFTLGGTLGDLAGAWAYQRYGIVFCLIADAIATVVIFGVLPYVPRALLASRDGEASEEVAGVIVVKPLVVTPVVVTAAVRVPEPEATPVEPVLAA